MKAIGYNDAMQLEDEFGDIVGKARSASGMSADELAQSAGLQLHEVSRIESYVLVPDDETIHRIAAALRLDAVKLTQIARAEWAPNEHPSTVAACTVRAIKAPFGMYSENAYVFWCAQSRAAGVVDPGGSIPQIACTIEDEGLSPELVLITHAHADHTAGLENLLARYPHAKLVTSRADSDVASFRPSVEWVPADDMESIRLGELSITPLATPGHTAGATCYYVDGVCFVGDTLFAGSIGRPASSAAYPAMLTAIRSKVLSLPGDTVLYPGHGPATTVAEELEHNPFF